MKQICNSILPFYVFDYTSKNLEYKCEASDDSSQHNIQSNYSDRAGKIILMRHKPKKHPSNTVRYSDADPHQEYVQLIVFVIDGTEQHR